MLWLPIGLLVGVVALLVVNLVVMMRLQRSDRRRSDALTLRYDELQRLLTLYSTRLELASSLKFEKSVTSTAEGNVEALNYRSLPRRMKEDDGFGYPPGISDGFIRRYEYVESPTGASVGAVEPSLDSWKDVVALGEARRAQKGAE